MFLAKALSSAHDLVEITQECYLVQESEIKSIHYVNQIQGLPNIARHDQYQTRLEVDYNLKFER